MAKIVAAHQPHFWPWLGYLNKWQQADLLIMLDDVDFPRREFVNRNRILIGGQEHWLTLPVERQPLGTAIKDIRVSSEPDWPRAQLETLRRAYPQAARQPVMEKIEALYQVRSPWLLDWCLESMRLLKASYMPAVADQVVLSSDVASARGLKATNRLVTLCQAHGATVYLSGSGAKGYLQEARFREAGIEVRWLESRPVGHLSALHYLLIADETARRWLEAESRGHVSRFNVP